MTNQLTINLSANGADPTSIFRIEGKQLIIPEDLSWGQYVTGMNLFKRMKSDVTLYHAQFVKYGQLKFGADKVNECMSQLEFLLDDARKAIDIASIPDEVRHDNLKSEHYIELSRAKLTPKQQAKWARVASEQNLTPSRLKESIKQGEVVSESVANRNHGVLSLTGIGMELSVWLRRVGKGDLQQGLKELSAKPADQRKMLAEQIKLAVDIYEALTKPAKKKAAKKKPAKAKKKPVKKVRHEGRHIPAEALEAIPTQTL